MIITALIPTRAQRVSLLRHTAGTYIHTSQSPAGKNTSCLHRTLGTFYP